MEHLLQGYQLCAATEGKSPNAIAIVTYSVSYFQGFLTLQGIGTDVTQISQYEIRAFILHLQQKRCFSNHRFNHVQDRERLEQILRVSGLIKRLGNLVKDTQPLYCRLHNLDNCYIKRSSRAVSGEARPIIYEENASTVSL